MAANNEPLANDWWLFVNWEGGSNPFSLLSGATHHVMSVIAPNLPGDESEIRLRFDLTPFALPIGPSSDNFGDSLEGFSLWAEVIKGNHLKNLTISLETSLSMTDALVPPNPSDQQTEKSSHLLVFNPDSGESSTARCVQKLFAVMSVDCNSYDLSAVLIKISIKAKVMMSVSVASPQQAILDSPALQDFKNMYSAEGNNYPDIKLKSKDNMIISAHKFILAARSSHFRQLLKEKSEETTELEELAIDHNAKPLLIILHWMYTDEIADNVEKHFEEVLEAAKCFQLENLIKGLDHEMIQLCNRNNMFELITLAKKLSMTVACKEISKFIKKNVDSFAQDV